MLTGVCFPLVLRASLQQGDAVSRGIRSGMLWGEAFRVCTSADAAPEAAGSGLGTIRTVDLCLYRSSLTGGSWWSQEKDSVPSHAVMIPQRVETS